MFPPHPQLSLPTPRYFTFHGSTRPFSALSLAIGPSAAVMYSTHFASSSTVPDPTFPLMYGSQPIISQRLRNSCVPKELSSTVPPQLLLTILGLLSRGPMPSLQWYSSAKHPPGHLITGTLSSISASSTSLRYPSTLGISDSGPTQSPP